MECAEITIKIIYGGLAFAVIAGVVEIREAIKKERRKKL
jgi:glutamate-1-semialdehyde aminotransferase